MSNWFLRHGLTSFSLLLAALTSPAAAQTSAKSVTLVVPYAAGGGTDTVARLIGEQMARALGRNVIIENEIGRASCRERV